MVIPVVYGRKLLPFLPALLESRWPGFGLLVMHLPVTRIEARDAGRGQWGYTKFMADMRFTITPEYNEVKMDEEGSHILTMRVMKRGVIFPDCKPLVTYSVKDLKLIKTTVAQRGICKKCFMTSGSFLTWATTRSRTPSGRWKFLPRPCSRATLWSAAGFCPRAR